MNTLSNGIMEIVVQAILSILGVLATYLTAIAIAYFKKKKEELVSKIGVEQYNATYNIAKSIYYAVEQQFRFIPQAGSQKKEMFDDMLLKKIPQLKQQDLDYFREAIVGEINKQLEQSKIFESIPLFNPEEDEADPEEAQA